MQSGERELDQNERKIRIGSEGQDGERVGEAAGC